MRIECGSIKTQTRRRMLLGKQLGQLRDIDRNPPRLIGHNNQALSGSIDCSDFSRGWPMQAGRPFSRNSL
jgi:hypothetical protein